MSSLVRIAATFFISATILVFLIKKRAENLKLQMDAGAADELVRNEQNMILLGGVVSGALILGGFILLTWSVVRHYRKES